MRSSNTAMTPSIIPPTDPTTFFFLKTPDASPIYLSMFENAAAFSIRFVYVDQEMYMRMVQLFVQSAPGNLLFVGIGWMRRTLWTIEPPVFRVSDPIFPPVGT